MSLKNVAVNPDKQALADLRAQVDRIDGVLHDLLRERADVQEQIRKLKNKQTLSIRPGREAQILRALLSRPQGKIPEGLVVNMWREMMSAFTLQEGALKIGVYAPAKGPDLWDLSRDFFGSFTTLVEMSSAAAAIKAVQANKIHVAVVPPPVAGEKDIWWSLLANDKKNVTTVFASLPFENLKAGRSNVRNSLPMGLAVGRLYPELTGDDFSYLVLQCVHVPEAEMRRLLSKAGYKVRQLLVSVAGRSGSAPTSYLVETEGYIGRNDTRLSRIRAMLGSRLQHMAPLGGYPAPVKARRS
ncbi:MAG: chorismate mutase [Alphaproteobacteria bacterium]|nr:chorismate mutase [Alphaproteobacteria bacterium]MBV8548838.1 chorismate mutase [Alphaproteobacteria bacterium]